MRSVFKCGACRFGNMWLVKFVSSAFSQCLVVLKWQFTAMALDMRHEACARDNDGAIMVL